MHKFGFILCFLLLSNSLFAKNHLIATPTTCTTVNFSASGSQYWKTITLTVTNHCGQALDFQNSMISFQNTSSLNTSFWGNFSPLSYPDNNLQISSQLESNGLYLASLNLHFPSYPGANSQLPNNSSFTIIYGAPSADYLANSVNVYLANPIGTSEIDLTNTNAKPVNVTQNYALIHLMMNGQLITDAQVPWQTTQKITGLMAGTYTLSPANVVDSTGTVYQGSANPATLTLNAGQIGASTISYAANTGGGGRMIAYLPGWKTPPSVNDLVSAGYTHIIVAFGVFSTSNPGQITSAFDTISASYIKSLQNAGIKVLLSLGGASTNIPNTSINFHQVLHLASSPTTFEQTFVQSLTNLINQYGFNGFDFDIESGLGAGGTFSSPQGDIAVLAAIINTLHTNFPSLLLTLAPQTANVSVTQSFNETWGNYASLVMQTYSSLAWVGIQIYNSGCMLGIDTVCYDPNATSSPNFSVVMATDLLTNWPAKTSTGQSTGFQPYLSFLNPSQIVLGYLIPNARGQGDGNPIIPISTIKRAIQCLRTNVVGTNSCDTYVPPKAYAGIGGVFGWEATYDQNNQYAFAKGLHNCVVNGNCT